MLYVIYNIIFIHCKYIYIYYVIYFTSMYIYIIHICGIPIKCIYGPCMGLEPRFWDAIPSSAWSQSVETNTGPHANMLISLISPSSMVRPGTQGFELHINSFI